jgi:hypothetical protein
MGQDIVNIVAAVVLLSAVYFVNKASVKALLIWSGILLYLIYAYVIYAFEVHFNRLFLVSMAILGLSFYALIGLVIHLHLDQLQASFSALGWVPPRVPKSGLSALTAKQNYLRRLHTACHPVVFGVLERTFLSATSSEGEDGFH